MATIDQRRPAVNLLLPGEERFVLNDIPWRAYVAIGSALENRSSPRLTFDRGRLEFMTPRPVHEIYRCNLRRLIETMAEECQLEIKPGGSITFRREDLDRGLELDDCFWIEHEAVVRGRLDYDTTRDPPPDLGVEIEITRSSIDRMALFAATGIQEVWRFNGESLSVGVLQTTGMYSRAARSPTFPWAPLDEIVPFIIPSDQNSYLAVIRDFRKWIRQKQS